MRPIRVEVVYALREAADVVSLELPAGSTARDAVTASGIATRHPELDVNALGIYGKRVPPNARLADGDRVEIYRPLALDPKERRRQRARAKRGNR
jgi:putative ubiquitin-RnfH superfamily antitoxin RatB of RatAB toxin-antitoxin module